MILAFLTFFTGIAISAIAIYYSVLGLASIFSAAALSVIIMGTVLEISKLVTAWWLKANWYRTPWSLKGYLTIAVVTLMLITSMGIFGYLSKAHSDQSLVGGDVQAKIAVYDEKIKIAKENIDANRRALKQMDEAVDQVMGRSTNEQGANNAVQIRRSQAKERTRLLEEIQAEQKRISELNEARAPIASEVRKVEAEVGPIKYIAALIYGDNPDSNLLEKAVVWVILTIVFVFDPLAVLLLLASQMSFQWAFQERKEKESLWAKIKEEMRPKDKDEEPKYEKDDGPLTEQQVEQIIESAPKPKEPSIVQSYLTKPGIFFKWRPQPKEEVKIEEVKVEESKPLTIETPEVKLEDVKVEDPQLITVDSNEVKVNELSAVPIQNQVEAPIQDNLDSEKKK